MRSRIASHTPLSTRVALGALFAVFALTLAMASPLRANAAESSSQGLSDGTYAFDSFDSNTGMIITNNGDETSYVVIRGDEAYLVLFIYSPDKYDALWKGKRSEAPADPATAEGLVGGAFISAEGYSGSTRTWTDSSGYLGEAGATYKCIRFTVPISRSELDALTADGSDRRLYVVVRRAPWSPSNPGSWMGSGDNYLTLGGLEYVSDSLVAPDAPDPIVPPEEAPIDKVKALISAIPLDPYDITEDNRAAIETAKAAYDELDANDRAALDEEILAKSQSYGRVLESALWTLESFDAVDDSTTLADGTYTGKAMAQSDMGKSTSARARAWSVEKVVVKDGKAMAVISRAGTTPLATLHLGGVEYTNVDTEGGSRFEIPVDLNSDMYFAVKIQGAVESTDAIAYHFLALIDESRAKPDPVSDPGKDPDDGGDNPGDNPDDGGKDPSDGGKDPAPAPGNGGLNGGSGGQGTPASTGQGSTGTAASAASRTAGTAAAGTSASAARQTQAASSNAKQQQKAADKAAADDGAPLETMADGGGAPAGDSPLMPLALAGIVALAAACGAAWFVWQYRRAERSWQA